MKTNIQKLKRVIVDFKKLTPEILGLLVEKYPFGYDEQDIIRFKNAKGQTIEAVEVVHGDTNYLVKVSVKLANSMENYEEDDAEMFTEVSSAKIEASKALREEFE